jgi:hypothetical protein
MFSIFVDANRKIRNKGLSYYLFPIRFTLLEVIMSFRSNVVRRVHSVVCVSFASVFGAFADTIRMKDGSKVKGKIVGFSGGKFVVAVGDGSRSGRMTLVAADIESIDFDTPRSTDTNVLASNRTSPLNDNVVSSNRGRRSRSRAAPSSRLAETQSRRTFKLPPRHQADT